MKSVLKIILLLILPAFSNAQDSNLDRLKLELKNATNDTLRMAYFTEFYGYYYQRKIDSALYYNEHGLFLSQKLKLKIWEAWLLGTKGNILMMMGNYPGSYQSVIQGLNIAQDPENEKGFWRWRFMPVKTTARINRLEALAYLHQQLGNLYNLTGDTAKRILENLEQKKNWRRIK